MSSLTPIGHKDIKERKNSGAHYTPKDLSDYVAKQIVDKYVEENKDKKKKVKVIDPAVGDGELLTSLLKQLTEKGYRAELYGFDIDPAAIKIAQKKLKKTFPDFKVNLYDDNFLNYLLGSGQVELFNKSPQSSLPQMDMLIANPPYVRTQILGSNEAQKLSKRFSLGGRVDLYFIFLLGISEILKRGGIAGIIVSNRFMTTKSGKDVRKNLTKNFDILHLWDLGDSKLFEAAVLPAVLLLKKRQSYVNGFKTKFTSIYTCKEDSADKEVENIFEALEEKGLLKVKDKGNFLVRQGVLSTNENGEVWRLLNKDIEDWINTVNKKSFAKFKDVVDVKVGVKTTADNVFIKKDWSESKHIESALLKDITTHHVARRYKPKAKKLNRKILYTHIEERGKRKAVDLDRFPNAEKYLTKHRKQLEGRKYVIEAGRKWYEIWVPHSPSDWKKPKVVFRDISAKSTFWIDLEGTVVNGDCYWLRLKDGVSESILWLLLAVGNSSFIERYYDYKFNNKLYAGRRRFITQYVNEFPIPNPDSKLSKKIISLTKRIFKLTPSKEALVLEEKLDKLVWESFGLSS